MAARIERRRSLSDRGLLKLGQSFGVGEGIHGWYSRLPGSFEDRGLD
jgi:hypothetical protein